MTLLLRYFVIMINAGYKMKKYSNLKYILEMVNNEEPQKLTKEEKSEFVQAVKNFSALGENIYPTENLKGAVERVRNIVERAEMVVNENADWFDKVTMSRSVKDLNASYKVFESAAQEIAQLQERMSMAYDDIGHQLSKYFDID